MHIGKRIKEVLELQGHNVVWLASQISCERSNIYNMFKRDNIGVDLLQKVCCALGHDFFKDSPRSNRCDRENCNVSTTMVET